MRGGFTALEIKLELSPFLRPPNLLRKKQASTKRLIGLINLSPLRNHLQLALHGGVSVKGRNALRSDPDYALVHVQG